LERIDTHLCSAAGGLLLACFAVIPAEASESFRSERAIRSLVMTTEDNSADSGDRAPPKPTESQVRLRTLGAYAAGASGLVLYANKNWWGEGFNSEFQTIDEGWFGQDTTHGGADKLGHAFSNYLGTRLFARLFEWAGQDEGTALKLAFGSVLGTFTVVEILDGFTDRWKFSKEDALMNAFGASLAVVMEKNPGLDRWLDFRFQYKYSEGSGQGYDPFGDYSGQTYLMVGKASGIPGLREHRGLRYFELAVGYGTRGYHLDPNLTSERFRYMYYGISLNLAEILDQTVFRGARASAAQRAAHGFFEVIQIPGTAALARKQL
jgi:hypothetical protein